MQVVAVLSLKGGVGKTTVALGLAGAAQQHGVRTLLVDLDPQANATIATDAGPSEATVADVLDDPRRSVLRRAIVPSGWGEGLDVLVGAEQTERHNHPDPGPRQLGRLARALRKLTDGAPLDEDVDEDLDDELADGGPGDEGRADRRSDREGRGDGEGRRNGARRRDVRGEDAHGGNARSGDARGGAADDHELGPYRLVVIDCPPSLGQLTRSALAAAHRAVLVTDPTMFAVSGVQRAFDAVQAERQRANPGLQPLGVLINRVRPRNAEHEFRVAELRELFGPLVFSGVLPDRSAIQQAQGACVPVQRWDTPGAREASAVFTTLLGRVLRSERRGRVPMAPPATR